MTPFLLLGTYIPSGPPKGWKCWRIGRDLTRFSREKGLLPHFDPLHGAQEWAPWYDLALHAEVKKRTPKNPKGEDWHQDGDLTAGAKMDCALLLWASTTPTEFRVGSRGRVAQPEPFDVVLFRNLLGYHRRPPGAPRDRFMFRQRVKVPTHLLLP